MMLRVSDSNALLRLALSLVILVRRQLHTNECDCKLWGGPRDCCHGWRLYPMAMRYCACLFAGDTSVSTATHKRVRLQTLEFI